MSFWTWLFGKPLPPPVVVDDTALITCRSELADCLAANKSHQDQIAELQRQYDALRTALGNSENKADSLQVKNQDANTEIAYLIDKNISLNTLLVAMTPTLETLSPIVYESAKDIIPTLRADGRAAFWWDLEKALWLAFAKPSIEPYEEISGQELKARVDKFYDGSNSQFPILEWCEFGDGTYRITTVENIRQIYQDSYVGLIPYVADLHDCEDFSKEIAIHVTRYTLNSCLQVWGDSEWGYHAYNIVVCSDGVIMLEPQLTGEASPDSPKYFTVLPAVIAPQRIVRKVRDI